MSEVVPLIEARDPAFGRSDLRVSRVGLGCNNFGWRVDLEQTRRVDMIVLDKTGTVTEGKMELAEVALLNGATRIEVAFALEKSQRGDCIGNDTRGSLRHTGYTRELVERFRTTRERFKDT